MDDRPKRILLVDDEPLIQRSMQKTLTRAGYEVHTAGNCSDGLATFQDAQGTAQAFDMALLDLNMPGFDGSEQSGAGLELLSALIERQPNLPVVVLSAYDEVNKAKEAVTRGARGYCVKGREENLLATIQEILPL